ncbi:hypothetical protein MKX01_003884, partial [Papaver californicum]
ELVPMEHMESVKVQDKVSVTKVQDRSSGIETATSTGTLKANTSVCLNNDSAAFCQTSKVSK